MSEYSGKKVATFRERFCDLCDSIPQNDTAIADALDVSRQTVCSWKSGTRSPKKPTIKNIASKFTVDVAWLMGFDVPKEPKIYTVVNNAIEFGMQAERQLSSPKTPEARILAKGIDKMPQAQREAIINMMQGLYPGLFEKGSEEDDT